MYIALPPLYRLQKGAGAKTHISYAWTDTQLAKTTKAMGKGYTYTRFKGLGTILADQLWETTILPTTRTHIRVRIHDAQLATRRVTTYMGDRVTPRRTWITTHVLLHLEHTGSIHTTPTANTTKLQFGAKQIVKQLDKLRL